LATELVTIIGETGSSATGVSAVLRNAVVFLAYENSIGCSLWRSDGTTAGTKQIKLIRAKSPVPYLATTSITVLNGLAYFSADDGIHGSELWVSDGTTEGTMMVDLVPGLAGSNPGNFIVVDKVVYFSADNRVWKTDGTSFNTSPMDGDVIPRGNFVHKGEWIYFLGFSLSRGVELHRFAHEDAITGTSAQGEPRLNVFPNPVLSTFQITTSSVSPLQVEILSASGQRLSTLKLSPAMDFSIDMEPYVAGLYLIRIVDGKNETIVKIIKK
jgi:ELWxxDGT repeat protein